jgi:hypothetical protein
MSRRGMLRLLTVVGILALGGLTVRLALVAADPGPLSTPHAEILAGGGWGNCRKCHTGSGISNGCRDCHREIKRQEDQDRGYHGMVARQGHRECQSCHPEHLGKEYPLSGPVAWRGQDPEAYQHEHTDFLLTDRHRELNCDDCHNTSFAPPFHLEAFPEWTRQNTYLGLSQECLACHEDIHAQGRAADCQACHDQSAFKPAPHFRHDDYFVLEGIHAEASCARCHLWNEPNETASRDYAPHMPFKTVRGKTCGDCHTSPHRTDFGKDCTDCHLAQDRSWSLGRRGVDVQAHHLTGFKLTEAHTRAACEACHNEELPYGHRYPDPCDINYQRHLEQCQGCHQDPHAGQFISKYPRCLDCHTQKEFRPSTMTVARHSTFFELAGAHEHAACETCHTEHADTQVQQFAGVSRQCRDCHEDIHQGQFMDPNINRYTGCSDCHTQEQFRPSTITAVQHAEYYELEEAHAALACATCHPKQPEPQGQRFVGVSGHCRDCHADPHLGQFQDRYPSCSNCHGQTRFTPVTFDLEKHDTVYPLTGAHRAVACTQCHQPHESTAGAHRYRQTPRACASCHLDRHRGQFLRDGQVQCERCHSHTEIWSADRFDHEKNSAFPLQGQHQKVSCAKCHPGVKQPDGTLVTQYRPVGTRCEDCHAFLPEP